MNLKIIIFTIAAPLTFMSLNFEIPVFSIKSGNLKGIFKTPLLF
jgi:hypothetical protein